jgi:hypothetical protein
VSDTSRLESYQHIDNRRRDRPGPASARVEEASEQGTSPLHPRAPGRRHLPRPSLQRSSPARSRRRTPIGFAPPRGRPGKLPAARGSIGARSSCLAPAGSRLPPPPAGPAGMAKDRHPCGAADTRRLRSSGGQVRIERGLSSLRHHDGAVGFCLRRHDHATVECFGRRCWMAARRRAAAQNSATREIILRRPLPLSPP